MLSPKENLVRAALNFGKWREKAHRTKTLKDRIQFVHSENRLGMAAQALYEDQERLRVTKRRSEG